MAAPATLQTGGMTAALRKRANQMASSAGTTPASSQGTAAWGNIPLRRIVYAIRPAAMTARKAALDAATLLTNKPSEATRAPATSANGGRMGRMYEASFEP